MKKIIPFLFFSFIFITPVYPQKKATTEDGQKIIIHDDGSWISADAISIRKKPFLLKTPSFKGVVGYSKKQIVSPVLKMIKANPNEITNTEAWFKQNGLSLPVYKVPDSFMREKGNCPSKIPRSYKDNMLIKAIYSQKYIFLVYGNNFSEGRYLLILDKSTYKTLHLLDFKNYSLSPSHNQKEYESIFQSITWASIVDDILYVSNDHGTYASESRGMNAYITAIHLQDYTVSWRSEPLICNTLNFKIIGDVIICGYGFTAEPDYLYMLNRYSGIVIKKIRLKTGPDYIIKKGNKLYVRTYNTDYLFEIRTDTQ